MSRPVDKRTGEQIQADTLERLTRESAREDAAAPAQHWSRGNDCSTATWCQHFALCLSETCPDEHPNIPRATILVVPANVPDVERLVRQAVTIASLLAEAGIGPCTLPEGVRLLWVRADELTATLAARDAALQRLQDAIPTNWLDPLLTGPQAVLGKPPYLWPDIERLLNAIAARLRARLAP